MNDTQIRCFFVCFVCVVLFCFWFLFHDLFCFVCVGVGESVFPNPISLWLVGCCSTHIISKCHCIGQEPAPQCRLSLFQLFMVQA